MAEDPTELVRLIETVGVKRVMEVGGGLCLDYAALFSNGLATYVLLRAGAENSNSHESPYKTTLEWILTKFVEWDLRSDGKFESVGVSPTESL